jgi:hypothetical protein
MIATSSKSSSTLTISRQYEFSRLQDQTLACAYEALIPVVSRHLESFPPRQHDDQITGTKTNSHQRSAIGA